MTDEPRAARGVEQSDEATSRSDYDMTDLRVENRRLRAGLEQMQGDVLRLSRALEPMHRVNEELSALGAEAALIRADRDAHRERGEQLTRELAQRHAEVEGLRGEVAQLRDEAERQRATLQGCRDQNVQLQVAGRADRERIERLTDHLQAVLNSSSWRLTRPMRWLKQLTIRTTPTPTLSE
jgi:hypothetical protein